MKPKKNVALAPDPRKPEAATSPKERWTQEVRPRKRKDAKQAPRHTGLVEVRGSHENNGCNHREHVRMAETKIED